MTYQPNQLYEVNTINIHVYSSVIDIEQSLSMIQYQLIEYTNIPTLKRLPDTWPSYSGELLGRIEVYIHRVYDIKYRYAINRLTEIYDLFDREFIDSEHRNLDQGNIFIDAFHKGKSVAMNEIHILECKNMI